MPDTSWSNSDVDRAMECDFLDDNWNTPTMGRRQEDCPRNADFRLIFDMPSTHYRLFRWTCQEHRTREIEQLRERGYKLTLEQKVV